MAIDQQAADRLSEARSGPEGGSIAIKVEVAGKAREPPPIVPPK